MDLRIRFPFISPTGSTQVGEGGTFQSFDEIKIHHLLSFFINVFLISVAGSFSFNGKEDESRCEVVLSARWNAVESVLHVFT